MHIELTPEIEKAVLAESSLTGLTPTEITLQALAEHTVARQSAITQDAGIAKDVAELRREAVARIVARSKAPGAPRLDLPEGMSIRQWIHLGHKY